MKKKLIQVFIPLYDNQGILFPKKFFNTLQSELSDRYGGLTVYQQMPATGLWKEEGEPVMKDDLVIYEVMADEVDTTYWSTFKTIWKDKFRQEELLIRSMDIDLL